MDREVVLDAARAIRPYLTELRPLDAGAVDATLASMLAEENAVAILDLLRGESATWQWFLDFAKTGLPPDIAATLERGGYEPAPGHGEPVDLPRFDCPLGDYTWYRRAIGQQPPNCPTHGVQLERR